MIMFDLICMVHGPQGFFMNWLGKQTGKGFEYRLRAIAMSMRSSSMVEVGGRSMG